MGAHLARECRQLRKERMGWFEKEKEYQNKLASLEANVKIREAMESGDRDSEALWRAQMDRMNNSEVSMVSSPHASPRQLQHTPASSPRGPHHPAAHLSPAHQQVFDDAAASALDDTAAFSFPAPKKFQVAVSP